MLLYHLQKKETLEAIASYGWANYVLLRPELDHKKKILWKLFIILSFQ